MGEGRGTLINTYTPVCALLLIRFPCIISHLERNAARDLQLQLKEAGYQVTNEIKEITYLDPFEVKEEF